MGLPDLAKSPELSIKQYVFVGASDKSCHTNKTSEFYALSALHWQTLKAVRTLGEHVVGGPRCRSGCEQVDPQTEIRVIPSTELPEYIYQAPGGRKVV